MQSIRRAAVAASSLAIAPSVRLQTARARVLRPALRSSAWKPQPSYSFLSVTRSYATGPEKAADTVTESASNAASQASESLKGTAEATKEFAGQALSGASDAAKDSTEAARDTASTATDKVSGVAQNAAEDAAAFVPSDSAAPSSQSSPIRSSGSSDRQDVPPSPNLYLGNLYFEVSQNAIREEFSRFGEVKNVKVIYDSRGLSKGFGYVEFATTEEATAAVEALDQQVFEGRRMAVQFAVAQKPKIYAPRNQDGFRHSPSKTLYIGNMSFEMSDKDLNDLFREIKNVTDVRVAIDRRTGQPRGYAHADFLDVESATKAAEVLQSKTFYGRNLRVDYTISKGAGRVPLEPQA